MVKPAALFTFLALFLLSAWMLIASVENLKKGINSQALENQKLLSENKKIATLKEKWEHKTKFKQTLTQLRAVAKLTRNLRKGSRYILEYSPLNPDELNRLTNILFNSSCVIKVYEIKRLDASNASVYVEIDT